MKIGECWLRDWVNPPVDTATLAHKLSMAGHECEFEALLDKPPTGVVVGRIVHVTPHPEVAHLHLCGIQTDAEQPVSVVCGASNVANGMTVALALPGAELPGGVSIVPMQVRGQRSEGMLCSAAELGIAEQSDGIMELDANAPLGANISNHLRLHDNILDLELTPNRGDCLSIAGLARDVAAVYGIQQTPVQIRNAVVVHTTTRPVAVDDRDACPHYVGRTVRDLKTDARTPDWMRERLRRCGIRCIHPLVDITNYVMLELGQPMHAFDNHKLNGTLRVRRTTPADILTLLDGQQLRLVPEDLVIADDGGVLALAGVMGGATSGVTEATREVFLESACFEPTTVAKAGRRHKLITDARHRFERGVDPALQRRALERATTLVLDICGGNADSIIEVGRAPMHGRAITLRRSHVTRLLGCDIAYSEVSTLLTRLGIEMQSASADTWRTRVPTCRYDLTQEADLVEEVGRLHGYDRIEPRATGVSMRPRVAPETHRGLDIARSTLVARGYREIVSYSFVDPELLARFTPEQTPVPLDNPMAATMSVMRTTLWCGLLTAWNYNRQRQRSQARLFEAGTCFELVDAEISETHRVAGLLAGTVTPRQWADPARAPDFYDAKADLEALFGVSADRVRYVQATHPALHDGCCARIMRADKTCGWIGQLHPRLCADFGLSTAPVVFELDWDAASEQPLPNYVPLSSQPSVRRDLALEVTLDIPAQSLVDEAMAAGVDGLRQVDVFDAYIGKNVTNGYKSIALSLVFQDNSSTLKDEKVDAAVAQLTTRLRDTLGASVRGEGNNHHGTYKS